MIKLYYNGQYINTSSIDSLTDTSLKSKSVKADSGDTFNHFDISTGINWNVTKL